MTTKPATQGQSVIVDSGSRTRMIKRSAVAAVLLGVAGALWLPPEVNVALKREPITDPQMERGCKWPQHEGEMTIVTVLNGKLHCWRWK